MMPGVTFELRGNDLDEARQVVHHDAGAMLGHRNLTVSPQTTAREVTKLLRAELDVFGDLIAPADSLVTNAIGGHWPECSKTCARLRRFQAHDPK
jgi:hypothetical protein